MRIRSSAFDSASYSHHNYNCWAEDQFRAWHRVHVICPKQVFCRATAESHAIVHNLPGDVNWLRFSFGDILWIIARNGIPELLTALNLSRLYGRIMQLTQKADELELQTLLPKMVASISHLILDSNLSGSPSTSQQASPTVAICACLREVLPSKLQQDIGDLIGSVPSPKYLKVRSEEHIQIHQEGVGGLRPSRGCFHRILRWPFCGRTKAFSPEGPVAEAREVGVIPPLFANWRISSKVYIFGTSCPMKVRRSILLLGPAGLRKSHVLKCLWEMAPDSFFSPSPLVEPEEFDDSMFRNSCGGWPLALRHTENSLEHAEPSIEGDLPQPEEEEEEATKTPEGENEPEIGTLKKGGSAATMRRTQLTLLRRLHLRLNQNPHSTQKKWRLETTERLINCVRQAIKCGRIPIMISGTYLLSEWRSSAELACLSVLLAPEAPTKDTEMKVYRKQMSMWRETIFYAGHLIDLNLAHSPSCPERTAQQIMDFFEFINSGSRVIPWMPHTWVASEMDLEGTGFKPRKPL